MCCNKELEKLMDKTYSELAGSRGGHWKKCNYHQVVKYQQQSNISLVILSQVATAVQRKAENHFGVDFETVAGIF
jgi:hypothetical protein